MDDLDRERLVKVEDLAQGNKRRIEKIEKAQEDITELVRSVASIAQKQEDMDSDMKEIKADVKTLAGKPGQRWDSIVEKALLAIVAALIGWVMIKLGIS